MAPPYGGLLSSAPACQQGGQAAAADELYNLPSSCSAQLQTAPLSFYLWWNVHDHAISVSLRCSCRIA